MEYLKWFCKLEFFFNQLRCRAAIKFLCSYILLSTGTGLETGKSDNEEIISSDYTLHPSVYEARDSMGPQWVMGGEERRNEHMEYRRSVGKETVP